MGNLAKRKARKHIASRKAGVIVGPGQSGLLPATGALLPNMRPVLTNQRAKKHPIKIK